MAANGGDEKSLIIIIAGRVTLSDTGKCFWTSFRCVPAKTQRPETTWCKLNHRLEPSFQTHIHVSSLKNTTSVAQRASQGLLERLCVREGGRRNCISSQRIQRGTRARAIDDLTLKLTFLNGVLVKRGFSYFQASPPGYGMLCPPQKQHCSSSK